MRKEIKPGRSSVRYPEQPVLKKHLFQISTAIATPTSHSGRHWPPGVESTNLRFPAKKVFHANFYHCNHY
jgi:hypothetical protein